MGNKCLIGKIILIMEEKFIPFDRYEANVSDFKLAAIDYKYENRYNMNPADYGVTEEEIEWYLDAIGKAQKQKARYINQIKKNISVITSIAIILLCFILEKVFNSDPYWYLGAIVASVVFIPIILLFFIWENRHFNQWLKYIYRDLFFPPIQPYVERFLSIYQTRQVEYYKERNKRLAR
jgi:hypothetical protein